MENLILKNARNFKYHDIEETVCPISFLFIVIVSSSYTTTFSPYLSFNKRNIHMEIITFSDEFVVYRQIPIKHKKNTYVGW